MSAVPSPTPAPVSSNTTVPLRMPVAQWPEIDRNLWEMAQRPGSFLEGDKPASRWSPATRSMRYWAYGRWLGFLARHGELDPTLTPGDRVTTSRVEAFVTELVARVSPIYAANEIGGIHGMLAVIAAGENWSFLQRLHKQLVHVAEPSRDKHAHIVPAPDLLQLGIELMDSCVDEVPARLGEVICYRDGLLIAMLICCPIRIRNLAAIRIGRHLRFDGDTYSLVFTAAETKNGRPYWAGLPDLLTPYIDNWLQSYRPFLQLIADSRQCPNRCAEALWLARSGKPLQSPGIRAQIELRTKAAFGRHVWPHLFRDCAVTELVDMAPGDIGIAADLLGHSQLRTTEKHYIQAQGRIAHDLVQQMIARRRQTSSDCKGSR